MSAVGDAGSRSLVAEETAAKQEFVQTSALLGGMVTSATGYRSSGQEPALHRGLPSPYLTFIISLDGPVVSGNTAEHARSGDAYRTEILLGGLQLRPAYVIQPDHEAGVQLAVHPLAARALFGAPAKEVTALVADGVDVLGRGVVRLAERLHEQQSWDERFTAITQYLTRRVMAQSGAIRTAPRTEVVEAWRWLARTRGTGSMDGMSRHVSMSSRQLRSLFAAELGVSPKQIGRLMRFDHAKQRVLSRVTAGQPLDLSEVAQECGFTDHSHLVRDFRQFTGLSPTRWIREERRNIQAGGHRNGPDWTYDDHT